MSQDQYDTLIPQSVWTLCCVLIDRRQEKWQRHVVKSKFHFLLSKSLYTKWYMSIELRLLYYVGIVSVEESLRLRCLFVCSESMFSRWGWSLCLVQFVGVAVWSGCRFCWRWSMIWMHWWQRLGDQWAALRSLWLTRYVDVASCGLDVADVVVWLCKNCCWFKLELVCS